MVLCLPVLGHTKEIKTPYDPERAKDLLRDAGYPDGAGFPSVELFYGGDSIIASNLVKEWQEKLGVEIHLEHFEWNQCTKMLNEEPSHIYTMSWAADYPDPDNFMRVAHFQGLSRWHNETYKKLVEEASRVSDQDKRRKMYHEMERILADEIPIVPLAYKRWHVLAKPWVKNLRLAAGFRPWWKEIVHEPH